jgi:hypothetical protein
MSMEPVSTTLPVEAPAPEAPPIARLPVRPVPLAPAQRLQAYGSRALAEINYRVTRLGGLGLSGVALIVGAIAMLIAINLPQRASIEALRATAAQPGGAAGAAGFAAAEVGKLITRLPPRSQAPEIMEKVLAQANAAGVELPRGQYEFVAARDGVAAFYRVSLPVKAGYPQLRSFMDKTLLALPGVGVESLRIERKSVGDDQVEAEIKLALYVRDGA